MAKLMLVEDDNNLREIYEARLQAEGYAIVSARDGEEALVIAKAEKPDLIISDVMMPKISGFEMLDILRNTDDLKGVKIIMLTALGQSDDQQRADRLGADRYLVKSQVTLEDIVKVTHELLEDQSPTAPAESPVPSPAESAAPSTSPTVPVTAEPPADPPSDDTAKDDAQTAAAEAGEVETQIEDFVAGATQYATTPTVTVTSSDDSAIATPAESTSTEPSEPAEPPTPETEVIKPDTPAEETSPEPKDDETPGSVPIANKKIVTPIKSDAKKDISTLLALEEAKQAIAKGPPPPTVTIATNEAGATSEPMAEPPTETAEPTVKASMPSTTIIPTVEPPTEPAVVTPINGDKIDPSSIAL